MTTATAGMLRLTERGWAMAGKAPLLLTAPCIGCGAVVQVLRSGTYSRGMQHRCNRDKPAMSA